MALYSNLDKLLQLMVYIGTDILTYCINRAGNGNGSNVEQAGSDGSCHWKKLSNQERRVLVRDQQINGHLSIGPEFTLVDRRTIQPVIYFTTLHQ